MSKKKTPLPFQYDPYHLNRKEQEEEQEQWLEEMFQINGYDIPNDPKKPFRSIVQA